MKECQKFRFKIAVIGESQVGKTSLMEKFTKNPKRQGMLKLPFIITPFY